MLPLSFTVAAFTLWGVGGNLCWLDPKMKGAVATSSFLSSTVFTLSWVEGVGVVEWTGR